MTTPSDVTPRRSPEEGGAAARVGAGIFLSKALGFVRDRVTAHYFGASDFADAWRAGMRLPNVIRNLLGEGTLSASLVPVYAELIEDGREEEASRFAGAALGILATLAAGLALLGIAVAPALIHLFFPRWEPWKQDLTITLVRILFPMTGLFVVAAWALGILSSHRRFFVSYVAPIFWNLAMIAAMIGGFVYFGLRDADLVVALAWGALGGGLLTLLWMLPFVMRHLGGLRISLGRDVHGVDEAVRNFMPVVAARGAVNIGGWIDTILAGQLATGAIAVMAYAQTFYLLPISLFGISVAASELTELSRMRGEAASLLAERVAIGLRRLMFFLIPSTVGYLALGDVVVAALYQTGEFGQAESLVTWGVLAAYALGLPVSAASRVLSSAFYALRDTRTPARYAYLRVAISMVAGVALMIPADRFGFGSLRFGAAGLALGASLGAWIEYVLLRRALAGAIGPHGPGTTPLVRMTFAAALAASVGVALQLVVPGAHPVVVGLETLVPFGVVYLASATLLGQRVGWRRASARGR